MEFEEAFLSGIAKAWLLDSAIFIIIGSFGVVIGINFPNASYFFRSYKMLRYLSLKVS